MPDLDSQFTRTQQLAVLLSAVVKSTGGKFAIPKAVFMAIEDDAVLGMVKDPETGDVVLTLYEGEAARYHRMLQEVPNANA